MSVTEVAAVRPFQVGFPEADLTELRRRIQATRWPERETVGDDSQGVPLATMRELAGYWATDYDWGGCEARLNSLPNFLTEIDGWTSTSSTSARATRTRSRSWSRTGGLARSSSS
jgi:Epoxide hydrolase N terminus